MEELAGIVIIVVVGVIFGLFISAAFLMWGARIATIESRTYGKALGATFLGGIASFFLSLVFSVVPGFGTVIGFICGYLIQALIMMPIFDTTFGKALGATVIASVLMIVVVGVIFLISIFLGISLV